MSKKLRIFIVLALALGLGSGLWWLERSTRPPDNDASLPGKVTSVSSGPVVPTLDKATVAVGPDAEKDLGTAVAGSVGSVEPQAGPAAPLTAGDILAEPDDDYVRVAKKLSALALDSRAPMEDRAEALAHALNLSAGNEAEVLTPLVTNPALPDDLAETILAEALNRPLAYQADLYLAALGVRKAPAMQTLIREHLAFLTGGEDLGPEPASWEKALQQAKAQWVE